MFSIRIPALFPQHERVYSNIWKIPDPINLNFSVIRVSITLYFKLFPYEFLPVDYTLSTKVWNELRRFFAFVFIQLSGFYFLRILAIIFRAFDIFANFLFEIFA